ncbi:MAG: DUF2169 domain-containing protein [Polyangiaceae bacterium]|nr:DUF2169 domain-containing protein [Polyangiaceae bacterium]
MLPAVDNKTNFFVHPQLLLDKDGEKLVAIVKATFELQSDGKFDEAPPEGVRGMRMADVPWGKPEVPSIAYPADICLRKPGTDVIVVAKACPPLGKTVTSFDVLVQVGPIKKTLRIFGPRVWTQGGAGLTKPGPATETEMRYDYAFGGFDDSDPDKLLEEPRNPVGSGMVRDGSALSLKTAPCIEEVEFPITSFRSRPAPAGICAIGRSYEPRRKYTGTHDKTWLETRAPLPPEDFDDRFNNCASPSMTLSTPLVGGEEVALMGLIPGGGALKFTLPKIALEITFAAKGKEPVVTLPHLDTLLIDLLEPSENKPIAFEMMWRSNVRPPRKMKDMKVYVRERKR